MDIWSFLRWLEPTAWGIFLFWRQLKDFWNLIYYRIFSNFRCCSSRRTYWRKWTSDRADIIRGWNRVVSFELYGSRKFSTLVWVKFGSGVCLQSYLGQHYRRLGHRTRQCVRLWIRSCHYHTKWQRKQLHLPRWNGDLREDTKIWCYPRQLHLWISSSRLERSGSNVNYLQYRGEDLRLQRRINIR